MKTGKRCTKCDQWKTYDHYYRQQRAKDGHRGDCKACFLAAQSERLDTLGRRVPAGEKYRVKLADLGAAGWRTRAACLQVTQAGLADPIIWVDTQDREGAARAIAWCRICPVVDNCRDWHSAQVQSGMPVVGVYAGVLYVTKSTRNRIVVKPCA